ncbi:Sodium/hydrogen exchanger 3 [Phytophthora pseudosyringae]|uniref:Sodium/hydrogen exchanger 3 n=1 Tax=Phytophthora pseudosyringae TaxID=221518 RepID=A0A8T1VNL7_9STRA|nr:Sodium/hydrogen exchanger 3 [Phytophthora pseudosyringae]
MKPPAHGESAETGAAAVDPGMQTASIEASQASMQLIEAPAVPSTPEMAPAESDEEADEMVEALEDLILEAYNNMQIDGEYIFLPDEVAEKLHRVAEQMKMQDSGEGEQAENNTNAGEDSSSGDAAANKAEVETVKVPQEETPTDRPEPEQEMEQEQENEQGQENKNEQLEDKVMDGVQDQQTSEEEEARLCKVQALQAEAAELREEKHKRRIPLAASTETLFTELAPVPEIDESASSGPPSPSPPHSRSHTGANTPQQRHHTPVRGHGHFPPAPPISLSSTPSSVAASPNQSPASRTPDQSGSIKRKVKVLTYEKRREAALKLKEDKKKRELRIRESARQMRKDSKRQLEEAHQREMEEKRERVRRIREERLHRRSGKTAIAKGAKKDG